MLPPTDASQGPAASPQQRARLWPHVPASWRIGAAPGLVLLDKPSQVGCAPRRSRAPASDANEVLLRLGAAEGSPDAAWEQRWQLSGDAIGGHGGPHGDEDALASGVVCVVKDAAAQQLLERALKDGEVRSTWLAGVLGWPLVGGAAESAMRAGLASEGLRCEVRQQHGPRTLLEIHTVDGAGLDVVARLRARGVVVASNLGAFPVASEGDDVRAGRSAEAERRLWHRAAWQAPDIRALAPRPPAFSAWIQGKLEPEADRLQRALRRRHGLAHSGRSDAIRLYDDESSLVIERFGPHLVVAVYDALPDEGDDGLIAPAQLQAVLQRQRERALALADRLGFTTVWLKLRPRQANVVGDAVAAGLVPSTPLRAGPDLPLVQGQPGVRLIEEDGVLYRIDLADGLQNGIFLDQRDNRRRVAEMAAGLTVLNTFAYTCAFQVAAAVAGARRTVSVDASARALARGRENLAGNGQDDPTRHETLRGDVFGWLPRLQRRGEPFDLVVLDPPTYARVGKRRFSAGRDYAELVALAAPLVAPGGWMLACINHSKVDRRRFAQMIQDGCQRAGRRVLELRQQPATVDHPGARMKSAWVRLG